MGGKERPNMITLIPVNPDVRKIVPAVYLKRFEQFWGKANVE
jgi:hypothetical protein